MIIYIMGTAEKNASDYLTYLVPLLGILVGACVQIFISRRGSKQQEESLQKSLEHSFKNRRQDQIEKITEEIAAYSTKAFTVALEWKKNLQEAITKNKSISDEEFREIEKNQYELSFSAKKILLMMSPFASKYRLVTSSIKGIERDLQDRFCSMDPNADVHGSLDLNIMNLISGAEDMISNEWDVAQQ